MPHMPQTSLMPQIPRRRCIRERARAQPFGAFAHLLACSAVIVALGFMTGCATLLDSGWRTEPWHVNHMDDVGVYEAQRARLAARQEREHARMEVRHEAEAAALDAQLIAALNDSGRRLRELEVRRLAERRMFLADSRARLRLIDARVAAMVTDALLDDGVVQTLEELGNQRAAIELGLHALDLVGDAAWLDARRAVSGEIGSLARGVESLNGTLRRRQR